MNDFWFTWANTTEQSQYWSFLDGGNYFELPPYTSRVEQNQYDLGDRIRISVSNHFRVTLILTGQGWSFEQPTDLFTLTLDPAKKTVNLTCHAVLVTAL